jgi:histidine ammonia-lyase
MILQNVQHILSIELFVAARAADLRLRVTDGGKLGSGTKLLHDRIRKEIPYEADDRLWGPQIEVVKLLVKDHVL